MLNQPSAGSVAPGTGIDQPSAARHEPEIEILSTYHGSATSRRSVATAGIGECGTRAWTADAFALVCAGVSPEVAGADPRSQRLRRLTGFARMVFDAWKGLWRKRASKRIRRDDSTSAPAAGAPVAIGWVDEPAAEGIVGSAARIGGWALDPMGVEAVEIRYGRARHRARFGLPRHDVATVYPGYPDGGFCGFAFEGALGQRDPPRGSARSRLEVVAIAKDGRETRLGTRSVIDPAALETWRDFDAGETGARPDARPFFLLPALSGIPLRSAEGLDTRYAPYLSSTTRIGMRVPILYLRTTHGADGDYAFDPDFDTTRRQGARTIADDSLSALL